MKNITLIGMPSVGKSTVGIVLAKLTGRQFIDTDLILQSGGEKLPSLISRMGAKDFIDYESKTLATVSPHSSVIATGGSAVYGREGMEHLKSISTVIYLHAPLEELEKRLGDFGKRGVVTLGATSVRELYDERKSLYERYADITIDETDTIEGTVRKIVTALGE